MSDSKENPDSRPVLGLKKATGVERKPQKSLPTKAPVTVRRSYTAEDFESEKGAREKPKAAVK